MGDLSQAELLTLLAAERQTMIALFEDPGPGDLTCETVVDVDGNGATTEWVMTIFGMPAPLGEDACST